MLKLTRLRSIAVSPEGHVKNQRLMLSCSCYVLALLAVLTPIAQAERETKLADPEGAPDDHLGNAVAISGDYAIVGKESRSSALVWERIDGEWQHAAKLTAGDGSPNDLFGSDVSISGDYAIVGAPFHDAQDPERDTGAAYVFKRENGTWQQVQKLVASDGEQWDAFGGAIALDGSRAAIGAPLLSLANYGDMDRVQAVGAQHAVSVFQCHCILRASISHMVRGAVYIFELVGGVWGQTAKLLPSRSRSFFGLAVALSGDRVIIGAPHDDQATGAAYIFERAGSSWREVVKLFAPDAEEGDFFGHGLAIGGDWGLVGSERDDDGCGDLPPGEELLCESGAVYTIRRTGGTWQVQEKLTPSEVESMDFFGSSIAMDGESAAIGASGDDDACPPGPITSEDPRFCNPGAAYVYELIDGQWRRVNKLTASDAMQSALFGIDVGISGNRVIAGAPGRSFDELPDDFGAAYVYNLANDVSHEITDVLDAAGFLALISPGSIVSVFGSFAEQTTVGNTIPLLLNLDGFSVTFDGIPGRCSGCSEMIWYWDSIKRTCKFPGR